MSSTASPNQFGSLSFFLSCTVHKVFWLLFSPALILILECFHFGIFLMMVFAFSVQAVIKAPTHYSYKLDIQFYIYAVLYDA